MTTRTQPNWAAGRRGELLSIAGRGGDRPQLTAGRRVNTPREDGGRTNADPHGPSDLRYAYLTQPHD